MRTLLSGELTQAQSFDSDYYIKLEVQNGSGTWIDVGAALGKHWIVNASWGESVDTTVMQVTFSLVQQIGAASLSPLMSTSVLNVDDLGAYAPLLNVGRLVRASVATMAHGVALDVAKYRRFLDGRIDNVTQADSPDWLGPITLLCSDLGGWLVDLQVETSGIQYGTTPIGTALETVLQRVIDDNIPASEPAVSLYKQSTNSFAVTEWAQGDTKLMEGLSTLVLDSTGEDIRYRYDAAHASRLTWFNPDRTRVTVDATFGKNGYVLRQLDVALANIRNAGEMLYSGGKVSSTSAASILNYRRRFFRLPASSMLTTAAQAQTVLDAVVNDLSAPPGEAAADLPFFWPVQLYDRYTFAANNRQFDTDQTFAVMGYQHTIEHGQGSTTLTLTARIVGAFAEWLKRLRNATKDPLGELGNVQWTLVAGVTTVTFERNVTTAEIWAAADTAANSSSPDFTPLHADISPLPAGATSFVVPTPGDGQVTLVLLEPRHADLTVGIMRKLTITATPQAPHEEKDFVELPTTATAWLELTERGLTVTSLLARSKVGAAGTPSAWAAPTRVVGGASAVRGGVLGTLAVERDITLDATRPSIVEFQATLSNGAKIVYGPYVFDRDKNPNLYEVTVESATNRYVTIRGDVDTLAVGLYRATWKYEVEGTYAVIDVQATGTNAVAGLTAATSGTFTAKAWSDPVVAIGGSSLFDTRDIIALNGAGAAAAVLDVYSAVAPTSGGNVVTLTFRATAAPGGWTIRVFIAESVTSTNPIPTVNRTSELTPVPSAPPTVSTAYAWTSAYDQLSSGTRRVTMKGRAELVNAGVVMDTKYFSASWYTSGSA